MEKTKDSIYEIVTNQVIEALESGVIPWRQKWTANTDTVWPKNYASHRAYSGINVMTLLWVRMKNNFASNYWVTYNQAKKMGGQVIKGSKGTPVTFWKMINVKDKTPSASPGSTKQIPLLRYYTVFNLDQVDGIAKPEIKMADHDPIEAAQAIVDGYQDCPVIEHGNAACYIPAMDKIIVPELGQYDTAEHYYSTTFHELVHSTGHTSRLGRDGVAEKVAAFGSEVYSKEELVAEFGAAFLCGKAGIEQETVTDNAAYIAGWLSQLKDDRRLLVSAATAAQKAADYITREDD